MCNRTDFFIIKNKKFIFIESLKKTQYYLKNKSFYCILLIYLLLKYSNYENWVSAFITQTVALF
jgi:hypothetical protein